MAWLSVAAVGLTSFTLSIPLFFAQLGQVCSGAACMGQEARLHPEDLSVLAQWGLSPTNFVAYATVMTVVVALTWIAMGVLLFWRRSTEPRALCFALFLVVFGAQLADPGATLAMAHPIWWLPATALSHLRDASIILFGYLFPTGRFVPRWTRWLALAWIVVQAS